MLHSKFFSKYYPIEDVSDLFHLPQNDRAILVKWLSRIKAEISEYNLRSAHHSAKMGLREYRMIYLSYDRDILSLTEKVDKLDSYAYEIDERDIEFINDVIYRHMYIGLISFYCFPVRKKRV